MNRRSTEARADTVRGVVLYRLPAEFSAAMSADAERMGYLSRVAASAEDVASAFAPFRPELVLVNLDVAAGPKNVTICRARMEGLSKIVGVTALPCLLRTGDAIRKGATVVVARPTTFAQVMAAVEGRPQSDPAPMSLDRAIWEYLNQTLAEVGSISAAARRLRLDRTSLKRMLRKHPPQS